MKLVGFVYKIKTWVYLSCGIGSDLRTAVDVHRFIHMFINLERYQRTDHVAVFNQNKTKIKNVTKKSVKKVLRR